MLTLKSEECIQVSQVDSDGKWFFRQRVTCANVLGRETWGGARGDLRNLKKFGVIGAY